MGVPARSDRPAVLVGALGSCPRPVPIVAVGSGGGRGLSRIALAVPCIGAGSFSNKILRTEQDEKKTYESTVQLSFEPETDTGYRI